MKGEKEEKQELCVGGAVRWVCLSAVMCCLEVGICEEKEGERRDALGACGCLRGGGGRAGEGEVWVHVLQGVLGE